MTRLLMYFFIILPFFSLGQGNEEIIFDRVILHTETCMTGCPAYHLEINSKRNVRLYVEKVYKRDKNSNLFIDSSKKGYFIGRINKKLFRRLKTELQFVECKPEDNHTFYLDGAPNILIIYCNNQGCFNQSQWPSDKMGKLFSTLLKICTGKNLDRVTEEFDIGH